MDVVQTGISTIYFDDENEKKCLKKPYNLKTYYFPETGEYVFSCLTIDNGIQTTIYDKNMAIISDIEIPSMRLQKKFPGCNKFYYSIIYSQFYKKYCIVSDINCGSYDQFFFLIEEEIEEKEEIESKVEYVEEEEKSKLESKEKEEEVDQSTLEFNNKDEEVEESIFEFKREKETEVHYITDIISENKIFCKQYYNLNDILNGCVFMNFNSNYSEINNNNNKINSDGFGYNNNYSNNLQYINYCEKDRKYYYPNNNIFSNINNSYINCCCIPEGNYLYKNDTFPIINLCYSSCKICERGGNIKYHNCIKCKKDYDFELNVSNYLNCYKSNEIQNYYYNKSEIDFVKEIILNNFAKLDELNGKDMEMEIDNIIISLTTTKNQKNNLNKNKTKIDFGECEIKLKQKYNIELNSPLYILKLDVKEKGMKIPKIEYEIYYPLNNSKLIKLNLTICQDINIDISIPVKITEDLDKYNSSSDYYNDICSKATSDVGTDIKFK